MVESREGEGDSNKVVYIKLTSIQLCAVKIQKLLEDHQDKLLCSDFEAAFVEKYNVPLLPGQYGYPSLNSLVQALPGMAYSNYHQLYFYVLNSTSILFQSEKCKIGLQSFVIVFGCTPILSILP